MLNQVRFGKEVYPVFRQWLILLTLAVLSSGIVTLFSPPEIRAQGLLFNIEEATEERSSGQVNWTRGTISVSGIGVPPPASPAAAAQAMAYRAARVVASRNLLELVEGIRVDSETIVENYLVKSDTIKEQVSGFIRSARVIKHQNFPDGSVEVFLAMPLWGSNSLTSALLTEQPLGHMEFAETNSDSGYTGLVIDARGLGIKPATLPVVWDQDGNLVYGPPVVSRQAAERHGLVQYYVAGTEKDLSLLWGNAFLVAQKDKGGDLSRGGRRPLTIKGLKGKGALPTNIIISNSDAQKIMEDGDLQGLLRDAKVVIITDPLVAGTE